MVVGIAQEADEAQKNGEDSEEEDVVAKLAASKVAQEDEEEENNGGGDDEEVIAAERRQRVKQEKKKGKTKPTSSEEKKTATKGGKSAGKGGGGVSASAGGKKPVRISAATLKTRMSPAMLQNPIARKKIWANLMQMMIRRGYKWVQDRPAPADYEDLWPNNRGFLSFFHMHAADATEGKREPVYVVFCSKAGEPTLKSLQYPSRHIILVSDSLTGRARGALLQLPTKNPPLAHEITSSNNNTTTTTTTTTSNGAAAEPVVELKNTIACSKSGEEKGGGIGGGGSSGFGLKDVFVEAFVSTSFMFDLLKQRYLKIVQFDSTSPAELEKVYEVFERKRDLAHFPRMLDTDPVVRHLRLPVGSVIKTTRLSTLSAVHNAYRVIVRTQHEPKPS